MISKITTNLKLLEKFPDAQNYTSWNEYADSVYNFFLQMGEFSENEIAFKAELNSIIEEMNIDIDEVSSNKDLIDLLYANILQKHSEIENLKSDTLNIKNSAISEISTIKSDTLSIKNETNDIKNSAIDEISTIKSDTLDIKNETSTIKNSAISEIEDLKNSAKQSEDLALEYKDLAYTYMQNSDSSNSLLKMNNLSDLENLKIARENLKAAKKVFFEKAYFSGL